MKNYPNKILIIEDDLGLNELICEKMIECGFETHSALSANDAIAWLREHAPVLMIVDYNLNGTNANDLITELNEKGLVLPPFIISTGQGDERTAVEMMKLGARDYVIKDSNLLALLPTIVLRVMKEIENAQKLIDAQRNVELTKHTYVDIFNSITEAIYILDDNWVFLDVNKGAEKMYLRSKSEMVGKTPADLSAPNKNDLKQIVDRLERVYKIGLSEKCEFWGVRSNGEIFPKEVVLNKGKYYGRDVLIATARDITERKNFEAKLTKKVEELEYMNKFMINREVRMVEMKKEINELLLSMGQEKRYL